MNRFAIVAILAIVLLVIAPVIATKEDEKVHAYPTFKPSVDDMKNANNDAIKAEELSSKNMHMGKIDIPKHGDTKQAKLIRQSNNLAFFKTGKSEDVFAYDADDRKIAYIPVTSGDVITFPQIAFSGNSPINIRVESGTTTYIIRRR